MATLDGCELEEALSLEGRVGACADVAHLGRHLVRVDEAGREVCAIPRSSDGVEPGWLTDGRELRFAPGSEPVGLAEPRFVCPTASRRCATDADCGEGPDVRCDPEHRVCAGWCDPDYDDCIDGDVCDAEGPGGQLFCRPVSARCHPTD